MSSRLLKTPMVPLSSRAIIPARDLDKPPILEVSRLGIDRRSGGGLMTLVLLSVERKLPD